ncbi:MAG: hydrogenase expression/formation C-terminal domain-containing protein [Gammaproteobacteria bacterium]|nr:hydrogenase expression/formation C-terminal domain-containing protein [Gammaproteobacteria bacterium]
MHKFPEIPVATIGPGSQTTDAEAELAITSMPSGMSTYVQPIMPEIEVLEELDVKAGIQALEDALIALRRYQPGQAALSVNLSHLNDINLRFVNQALGDGEVSVMSTGDAPIKAQESVMAGIWRVQHCDQHDRPLHDSIEIGDVPDMVRSLTFQTANSELDTRFDLSSGELQNSPALLVELKDQLKEWTPESELHVINLTLLPLTDADLHLIGSRLGVGPVTILSRGYGNCRIGSTAKNNVWWIKYYNSEDKLILNTIEVTSIPEVALAAPEDLHDSIERLDEILALYR